MTATRIFYDGKWWLLRSGAGKDVFLRRVLPNGQYGQIAGSPDYNPTPPIQARYSTLFGACPAIGSSLTGTVTKWGQKTFLRNFAGIPGTTALTKVPGSSGMHVSWSLGIKVDGSLANGSPEKQALIDANNALAQRFLNGEWDDNVTASVTGIDPKYFYVELLHELDTKTNGSQPHMTLSLGQQIKTKFYGLVKAANPDLLVVMTLQGYSFSDTNTFYTGGTMEQRFGAIPHDVIGLDVDGIAPPLVAGTGGTTGVPAQYQTPYPLLTTRARNAQRWMVAHPGVVGYAFPEWGVTTGAVDDTDNQILADTWITKYGVQWRDTEPIPALFATWYDYGANPEQPGSNYSDLITQPISKAALQALISASVAPALA
jgi:hypothetical protein